MSERTDDPTIRRFRDEISALDRTIVGAVNARLELVERLKRYKESQGIPFLDPDRERQLLDDLARQNPGPLTGEGLRALYARLLEVTKHEVTRSSGPAE